MDDCRDNFRSSDPAGSCRHRRMEWRQFRASRVSFRFQRGRAGPDRKFVLALVAQCCISVDHLVRRNRDRWLGFGVRRRVRFRARSTGALEQ